ncbi:unnamed protein product [Tilletia laevis]|uniref:Uncharacterized protein n=1 Tax=Tilletia caries TaxID=13290 RepID=A0ABN7J9V3_9BASI|nr:hypothetical protein CF336_g7623 [Tilletia laevis]CAD6915578.1 unnamed protein product [Tilletia caries]CAD6951083.1 unnamed protein product [Tilletia laevis]CAD6954825.1 unnamed protein product [Tilletia caries]
MSSVHSNSPGPGEADDSLEFSSEESIREAIATDLAKSLAVIAEMDGISVAVRDRMVTGAETYWGRQLEQRLEARAQLVAEHEAREAAAKAARDAQAQRELEAQQQLEASTKAALNVSNMALPNLPARRPTTPPCPSTTFRRESALPSTWTHGGLQSPSSERSSAESTTLISGT